MALALAFGLQAATPASAGLFGRSKANAEKKLLILQRSQHLEETRRVLEILRRTVPNAALDLLHGNTYKYREVYRGSHAELLARRETARQRASDSWKTQGGIEVGNRLLDDLQKERVTFEQLPGGPVERLKVKDLLAFKIQDYVLATYEVDFAELERDVAVAGLQHLEARQSLDQAKDLNEAPLDESLSREIRAAQDQLEKSQALALRENAQLDKLSKLIFTLEGDSPELNAFIERELGTAHD